MPMTEQESQVVDVLLVEDDPGDVLMTREAFGHHKIRNELHVVTDGEQALQFLRRTGDYADAPRPGLILLDLNLPRRDGEHWLFSFSDNGIGIPAEYAERIFGILQRLHDRAAYPGTGIGLAMCRKIIEYHGGRIWLDTTVTSGARFCFTLPARPGDADG